MILCMTQRIGPFVTSKGHKLTFPSFYTILHVNILTTRIYSQSYRINMPNAKCIYYPFNGLSAFIETGYQPGR